MTLRNFIFRALTGLPLIRFALMLGGGMVATGGAAWLIGLLAWHKWFQSEAVDISRIQALAAMGLGCLALIGIVLVALAWGKLDKLNLNVGGNSVELDFTDGDKP